MAGLGADALQAILACQKAGPPSTWEEQEHEACQANASSWVAELDESGRVSTVICTRDDTRDDNPFADVLEQIKKIQLEAEQAEAEVAAPILERVQEELAFGGLVGEMACLREAFCD